ncbi:MAG TPA: rhodanese-like domain-containing protein [Terriglobia bacterium]|nr:rhodanese-like domain-containing protein [Terriglobia bacterium]
MIQPAGLARELQSSAAKPLLLQVGFERLYGQGHIPGSKYCGPGRNAEGITRLKTCVEGVPPRRAIVLYCGCCPWEKCPNIRPAFEALQRMGFTNVKVVHIRDNFGKDWAAKGYPVSRGE